MYFALPRKLLIPIIALVVAAIGFGVWLWWSKSQPTEQQTVKTVDGGNQTDGSVSQNLPSSTTPVLEPTDNEVDNTSDAALPMRVLALTFAERYGTYSTDANFQNLKDISSVLTPSFWERISKLIIQGQTADKSYYGVTTHALIAKVQQSAADGAVVTVSTQRQEQFSRVGEVQLSYQTLKVVLEKVKGSWLVDGASWQEMAYQ
jgi:hypothetical protein